MERLGHKNRIFEVERQALMRVVADKILVITLYLYSGVRLIKSLRLQTLSG